jgi:hypothetical protein
LTQLSDLDSAARELFQALNRSTGGDTAAKVSMYAIGETIGLDRETSARAAEDLIAQGLAEIRTLSGDIGLSEQGADLVAETGGRETRRGLGTESPLTSWQRDLVEQSLTHLKAQLGGRGLSFEVLSEMTADIRTVEAQLTSPKAKTAIVRECVASLLQTAQSARQTEWQRILEDLLGKDRRGD